MTQIFADADLRSKLGGLTKPLDLCDETGKVLAHVVPAIDSNDWERWEPQFDEEELQRIENSSRWYTSEEVRRRLESL